LVHEAQDVPKRQLLKVEAQLHISEIELYRRSSLIWNMGLRKPMNKSAKESFVGYI
jgi:hypothetical protein